MLGEVDERTLRRQDARLAQVPFVREDGLFWFASQGARNGAFVKCASDCRVLPPDEWRRRFGYPAAGQA